ncbi:MAG: LysR family transcriptional regulator substrate-binding protein [[Clostridium] scindens]
MQRLKGHKAAGKPYLTIGCTDTLNSAILFDLYRGYALMTRDLVMNLHIKTHYSYEVYGLLENHDIDLGFVYHHLHFKNIVAEPVLREKMFLIQAADTELKNQSPAAWTNFGSLERKYSSLRGGKTIRSGTTSGWQRRARPRLQVDNLLNLLFRTFFPARKCGRSRQFPWWTASGACGRYM